METIYIKNMVCDRCIMAVEALLQELQIPVVSVSLGEVQLKDPLTTTQHQQLTTGLQALGFALVDDKKHQLVTRIKSLIVALVHQQNGALKWTLSKYLHQALELDYKYISAVFSELEGTTIEKYLIAQKIEKV